MTQSSCKHDTKSKSHPSVKLTPVQVFSCKHPLTNEFFPALLKLKLKNFFDCFKIYFGITEVSHEKSWRPLWVPLT